MQRETDALRRMALPDELSKGLTISLNEPPKTLATYQNIMSARAKALQKCGSVGEGGITLERIDDKCAAFHSHGAPSPGHPETVVSLSARAQLKASWSFSGPLAGHMYCIAC